MVASGVIQLILAFLKQLSPRAHLFLTRALTAKTTDTAILAKMLDVYGARMENADLKDKPLDALLLLKETVTPSVHSTLTVLLAT
jgi:hypothetical protein